VDNNQLFVLNNCCICIEADICIHRENYILSAVEVLSFVGFVHICNKLLVFCPFGGVLSVGILS